MTVGGDVTTSPIYPPHKVVDTLGAGDTFNAATVYALSNGADVTSAIKFGCFVAGTKCGGVGLKGIKGLQNRLPEFCCTE